jgi:hypothetical protein
MKMFNFLYKKLGQFSPLFLRVLLIVFLLVIIPIAKVAATVTIDDSLYTTRNVHNGSSPTIVFTSDLVGYAFYVDSDGTCAYSKTTDGGINWGGAVTVDSQTDCIRIAVWYDRWTPGDSGTVIHISTMDSSDLYYTSLNTATDTLTTTLNATDINQDNSFTINLNLHSITKGTDGDLYMGAQDDLDSYVIKCSASCDALENWVEAGTNPFDLAKDWLILMPLAGGDIMAIRSDISAGDIQSKIYTDSNGNWAEGPWIDIDTDAPVDTSYDAPFGATLNRSNNNIYLVYAAQTDVFGTDDDVRAALYSGGIWIAKTDVLTDDAKGITGVKIAMDENTNNLYVLYTGQTTPGTLSSANIYYKKSADGMTSWEAEQGPLNVNDKNFYGARVNIMSSERIYFTVYVAGSDNFLGDTVVDLVAVQRRSSFMSIFPSSMAVIINQNQDIKCVSSPDIDLHLEAQNATQVVISNNESFINAEWEPFMSPMTKQWILESVDGIKTVYIIFKTFGGNMSNIYKSTFELKSSGCLEMPAEEEIPEQILQLE